MPSNLYKVYSKLALKAPWNELQYFARAYINIELWSMWKHLLNDDDLAYVYKVANVKDYTSFLSWLHTPEVCKEEILGCLYAAHKMQQHRRLGELGYLIQELNLEPRISHKNPNYALDVIGDKMAQEKRQADVTLNIDMLRAGVEILRRWDGAEDKMDEVVTTIFYSMLEQSLVYPILSSARIDSSNSTTFGELTKK